MHLIVHLTVLVICVIVQVRSEKNIPCGKHKILQLSENTRVKRAEYYSYPSRFYKKPPMVHQVKGPFSYTPPPRYKDEERHYPARISKVSRIKKTNEGLDDDDINNLVKYLSKKDLERIIESTGGKYTNNIEYRDDFYASGPNSKKPDYIFKETNDVQRFLLNNPNTEKVNQPKIVYVNTQSNANFNTLQNLDQARRNNMVHVNPEENFNFLNYPAATNNPKMQQGLQTSIQNYNQPHQSHLRPYQDIQNPQYETEESKKRYQIAYVTPHNPSLEEIIQEGNVFTDSRIMQEEILPKPVNLREEDYEAAYSNKAPTFVNSNSYQLENFGNLPLMNYLNSKLHSVSSYYVPHYTVTSNTKSNSFPSQSIRSSTPSLEPAPPKSAVQEQSDAHLKAIKIWTHKSKGTAYTLHNDGSLSLEKPNRPRPTYGAP